jgi:ribonuclease Z
LTVLGSGEAFDSELGNNACLLSVEGEGGGGSTVPTLLFDCGYQIPERLWRLESVYPKLDGIYLTHLHADHSFGVVPLLVRFWEEKRQRELVIIGPRGTQRFLTRLLDLGYPGARKRLGFPVRWIEVDESKALRWRGLKLSFARSRHSVLNLAVRVEGKTDGQRFSFGISGDGQLTDATRKLMQGVQRLLQEVYSRDPEISTHCDLKTLSNFVAESAITQVAITHIGRDEKSRVGAVLKQLSRIEPGRWLELRPGMRIDLV